MPEIKADIESTYSGGNLTFKVSLEQLLEFALEDEDYGLGPYEVVETLLYNEGYRKEVIETLVERSSAWKSDELAKIAEGIGAQYLEKRLDAVARLFVGYEEKIARHENAVEALSNVQGILRGLLWDWNNDEGARWMDTMSHEALVQRCQKFSARAKEVQDIVERLQRERPVNRYTQPEGYVWSGPSSHWERVREWRGHIASWLDGGEVPALPPEAEKDAIKDKIRVAVAETFHRIGMQGSAYYFNKPAVAGGPDVRAEEGISLVIEYKWFADAAIKAVFDE